MSLEDIWDDPTDNPSNELLEDERRMADEIIERRRFEDLEGQERVQKYKGVLRACNGLQVENVYSQRGAKEKILRDVMGYTRLTGNGKERIPLEKCSDAKIGHALRNVYRTAENYLSSESQ